ncbi:MAG: transposase [Bdellovibrionota bacterium]
MRQGNLFPGKFVVHHGGELARGRRKSLRPLSKKRPIHFVLKSQRRIYEKRQVVVAELQRQAEKFQIRIYDFAVASDHLHFVARVPSRTHYVKFIRALCGSWRENSAAESFGPSRPSPAWPTGVANMPG